ncbi:F-box domain-containing protein [Cedratvirus kamchatka]|uniref:F-box domain-containing protein n=1 Tax=Cedratvirus kamchatka TaxID=2716914 RepID=A0A6G8MX32_9VIRU|nr:F-box domain-containing protein [Cedratvirus kamchatka]
MSNNILFSVMCCCEAQDLFTLSFVCEETRSIFTSRAFWKARFTLLGIQHKEPSLSVYVRCLKIEKKILNNDWPQFIFYKDLNLDLLAEMNTSSALEFRETQEKKERLLSKLEQAQEVDDFTTAFNCQMDLQSLFNHYLVVQKKKDKYTVFKQREKYNDIGNEITKVYLLQDVNKIETLNVLLRLYKES